jgi:hypothetical protein
VQRVGAASPLPDTETMKALFSLTAARAKVIKEAGIKASD